MSKRFQVITAVYTTQEEKDIISINADRNNISQSEFMRRLLLSYKPTDETQKPPTLI